MTAIFAWWGGSAAVMIALSLLIGHIATGQLLGLLIDKRGRYRLTHLQLSLWTIVILSLVTGVFFGRWQHNVDPLGFTIAAVVLALLAISCGYCSRQDHNASKNKKQRMTKPIHLTASGTG